MAGDAARAWDRMTELRRLALDETRPLLERLDAAVARLELEAARLEAEVARQESSR